MGKGKIIANIKFMLYTTSKESVNKVNIVNFLDNKLIDIEKINSVVIEKLENQYVLTLIMKDKSYFMILMDNKIYSVLNKYIKDDEVIALFNVKPHLLKETIGKMVLFSNFTKDK